MAGILFLRDIDVDIQMRCRTCGHEGLLARGDLERRFGPSYPVLSIAPHYRCSRCHSKDVESSPGPLATPPDQHAPRDEDTVDAGIAALQGLLNAVRADRAPAGKDAADEDEDDIVDLMPQLREAEVEEDADDDLFERTMASLRSVAHSAPDGDDDAGEVRAPEPDTVAAEDEDIPFDRSLAALRDLIEADEPGDDGPEDDGPEDDGPEENGPEEDGVDPAAPSPPPPDPRAVIAELMEEEEEREPFFRPRESVPPSASEMELSLAALRALVEKAAEDGPEPESDADGPDAAPPEPEPAARARHAGDGDEPFDETIAALRSLIADRHRDADEDGDGDGDEPPPDEDDAVEGEPESLDDITEDEILSFAIRDPELASPELESDDGGMDRNPDDVEHGEPAFPAMHAEPPPPVPPPARTSHLNETLAKLRGMLELDRPEKDAGHREAARKDGDPAGRPRRR